MPTFLSGLPVHVLVVHAVVVLVPLSVLGAIVVAAWPRARRRWGWPVLVLTAVAVACVPIATSTGEGLEHNLPSTPAIEAHTRLGDELLPYAAGMLVALLGLLLVELLRQCSETAAKHAGPGSMAAPALSPRLARILAILLAALTVVLAGVTAVQVVRIGDSGARAAWGDTHYVEQPQHGGGDGG
jgi:hypothetical protein